MVFQSLLQAFKDLHGIRYIVDKKLPIWQRAMWAVFVAATIFGVFYVWFILSLRYNSNVLQTVIESSAYSIKNIPFPAVTLCNSNPLNMARIEGAADKFIPNATQQLRTTFKEMLRHLNILHFGWFDHLRFLRKYDVNDLNKLNITEVFHHTMFTCSELFVSCEWNDRPQNCCEIFFVQSTDYGLCYGFNSMLSIDVFHFQRQMVVGKRREIYTDYYGIGSGLRVVFNVQRNNHFLSSKTMTGVSVFTHRNYEWPTTGYFVPLSNSVKIALKPKVFGSSKDLQDYSIQERQCLFEKIHEMRKYRFSASLPYLQTNCRADCRRYYMAKYCNCTIELFYPSSPYTPCNITGILCMNDFNDKLFKGIVHGEYSHKCSCMAECVRIFYYPTLKTDLVWETENSSLVNINVFFDSPTILKYRTEASLHRLQFIVNFGGILAFFFGASIVSMLEMIHRVILVVLKTVFRRIKIYPIVERF